MKGEKRQAFRKSKKKGSREAEETEEHSWLYKTRGREAQLLGLSKERGVSLGSPGRVGRAPCASAEPRKWFPIKLQCGNSIETVPTGKFPPRSVTPHFPSPHLEDQLCFPPPLSRAPPFSSGNAVTSQEASQLGAQETQNCPTLPAPSTLHTGTYPYLE